MVGGPHNSYVAPRAIRVVAAATPQEKARVLDQLLGARPELIGEAEVLLRALLSSTTAEAIADEVTGVLGSLGFEELAGRAGRIPGRGYVHETDAAWELLEEALEPFLADVRRLHSVGLGESAAAIASGTVAGLERLRRAPDGQLIAFAGDDAIDTMTESVRGLADDLRLELDEATQQV